MTITTYTRQRAFHTSFDVGPLRSSADSIMNKLADASFFYFPIACCYRFFLSPATSRVYICLPHAPARMLVLVLDGWLGRVCPVLPKSK